MSVESRRIMHSRNYITIIFLLLANVSNGANELDAACDTGCAHASAACGDGESETIRGEWDSEREQCRCIVYFEPQELKVRYKKKATPKAPPKILASKK